MFMDESRFTMGMYQLEQNIRLEKSIPTFEEFWVYRKGSSCIGMVVALVDYVPPQSFLTLDRLTVVRFGNNLHIPDAVMQDADVRTVWKETNMVH
jgi:hypothetical protein